MRIGNRDFAIGKHTYIMGILNVTPDSFSDGGLYLEKDLILRRVEEMINEGCDIIDVGGESTRPGHEKVGDEVEITRVTPVIEAVKANFDIPVSLDTYKLSVAKAGITAGADMINDIWGLKYEKGMADLIAEKEIPCIIMHNRENPKELNHDLTNQQENKHSQSEFLFSPGSLTTDRRSGVIVDIINDLTTSLTLAKSVGIDTNKIILDPGIGFGKTYEENLYILNHLSELKSLGFPCLLGASRKSVIGLTLDLPTSERLEGTIITTVMAALNGYAFVRVHDIKANKRSIKMTEAIRNAN